MTGFTAVPASDDTTSVEATYDAIAQSLTHIPTINEMNISGALFVFNGSAGVPIFGAKVSAFVGPLVVGTFLSPIEDMQKTSCILKPIFQAFNSSRIEAKFQPLSTIPYTNYSSLHAPLLAGWPGILSSRLLPNASLVDPQRVSRNIKELMHSNGPGAGGFMLAFAHVGQGPRSVPRSERGAVHPAFRNSYLLAGESRLLNLPSRASIRPVHAQVFLVDTQQFRVWQQIPVSLQHAHLRQPRLLRKPIQRRCTMNGRLSLVHIWRSPTRTPQPGNKISMGTTTRGC